MGSENGPLELVYYPIVYKIEIHLFGPNNQYEVGVYRRRENPVQLLGGIPQRFLGTGDELKDWELGPETTKGFSTLRRKLAEQYVLQIPTNKYA